MAEIDQAALLGRPSSWSRWGPPPTRKLRRYSSG
jgi:hypothetical protein